MKFLGIILDFTMVYLHYALLKVLDILQFLWFKLECPCTASVVRPWDFVHGCTKIKLGLTSEAG